MSAETVPAAVRIRAQPSLRTVFPSPCLEAGGEVARGSLLLAQVWGELLERLLCSQSPHWPQLVAPWPGRAECQVGRPPLCSGTAARRGFHMLLGASAHPARDHSSICEQGCQSGREELRPASPTLAASPVSRWSPCGSQVPISHRHLVFSLHTPGFGKHCFISTHARGAGEVAPDLQGSCWASPC